MNSLAKKATLLFITIAALTAPISLISAPQKTASELSKEIVKLNNILASYRKSGRHIAGNRYYKQYIQYEAELKALTAEHDKLVAPKPSSTTHYSYNSPSTQPSSSDPAKSSLAAMYSEPLTNWTFNKQLAVFTHKDNPQKNIYANTIVKELEPNLGFNQSTGMFFDKAPGEGEDPNITPTEILEIFFEMKKQPISLEMSGS